MKHVRSEPGRGHLFRCPPEGCRLRDRKGVRYCHEEEWVNPQDNPRVFGQIPRWSREWKTLYKLRQSVERVFKGQKEDTPPGAPLHPGPPARRAAHGNVGAGVSGDRARQTTGRRTRPAPLAGAA